MIATKFRSRASFAALGCAALSMLAACSEPELILPGQREDIRTGQTASVAFENRSEPIRLAAQTANASWPQSPGLAQYRTAHPALSAAPARVWSVSIGEGDGRRQRITAAPVVGGGLVYTLDASSRVHRRFS